MHSTNSRSDTLVKQTTDTVRRMIVEGDLQLGEALSEARVAKWLNVSRTPVREAFAKLQIEGLVVSEPQRRTCVFFPTSKDLDDICDARCCLEARALTLAIERNGEKLGRILVDIYRKMEGAMESGDMKEYHRLDIYFHQAVFDLADNEFLNDAYQTISAKLATFRTRLATHKDYMQKGFAEHRDLGTLVLAGDLDAALAVLEGHISRSADSYWRLNIRSESAGMRHDHPEYNEFDTPATPAISSITNRRNNEETVQEIDKTGQKADDEINKIDETWADKNCVDEKRRGRPRRYVDDAARKRVWAARRRERQRLEQAAQGLPVPKRGRPRKSQTEGDAEDRSAGA